MEPVDKVLILTPVKDATQYLDTYIELIKNLDYPKKLISIGMLEGDSTDNTNLRCRELLFNLTGFDTAELFTKNYGFKIPDNTPRWHHTIQRKRREILAKARNRLIMATLRNEHKWVLWWDVDLIKVPPDTLSKLIAYGKDIIQPECLQYGPGARKGSFDLNAWRDHGKKHIHDLYREELAPLDSVGGTMLLVNADLHRDGLVFPPFPYGKENPKIRPNKTNLWHGELETEGFGIMAHDMGIQPYAATKVRIEHRIN
jgi:hypothetical protein